MEVFLKQIKDTPTYYSRTPIEDDNDFTILEDEDIFIYSGTNNTTYTLVIEKDNQSYNTYSNLVVQFSEENPTKAFILNYVPTQNYIDSYSQNTETPFQGTATYESIDYEPEFDLRFMQKGRFELNFLY